MPAASSASSLIRTEKELDLGSYELEQEFRGLRLLREHLGPRKASVSAPRALRVIPENGEPYEIDFKRLPDDALQDSGYALGVVDLWQNHPIEVSSRPAASSASTRWPNRHGGAAASA